jgi:hypothetical protein
MGPPAVRFAVAALATWRVTHLLAEEDGPADVVLRARTAAGASQLGELMDCFACMSLWVAMPLTRIASRGSLGERATCWLALSGAACLLQAASSGPEPPMREDDDGLLWEGTGGAEGLAAPASSDAAGEAAGASGTDGWAAAGAVAPGTGGAPVGSSAGGRASGRAQDDDPGPAGAAAATAGPRALSLKPPRTVGSRLREVR